MYYYLDSSALLKRYIREDGSEYVNQIVSAPENALFTAEITLAEVAAVIAAKHRAPGGISDRLRENLLSKFLLESADLLFLVAVERSSIDHAVQLSQRYRLRGYDAVQLAVALSVQHLMQIPQLSLTFVVSDQDLLDAAQAEGLQIDDPMLHP
jgi:predicted nucleic acid-binding protein